MLKRVIATASVLGIIVLANPHTNIGMESASADLGITDKEKSTLIKIANKKATELGINLERSNFQLTKEKTLFKAQYWPKKEKDEIIFGGHLTLYLERNGTIASVQLSP